AKGRPLTSFWSAFMGQYASKVASSRRTRPAGRRSADSRSRLSSPPRSSEPADQSVGLGTEVSFAKPVSTSCRHRSCHLRLRSLSSEALSPRHAVLTVLSMSFSTRSDWSDASTERDRESSAKSRRTSSVMAIATYSSPGSVVNGCDVWNPCRLARRLPPVLPMLPKRALDRAKDIHAGGRIELAPVACGDGQALPAGAVPSPGWVGSTEGPAVARRSDPMTENL